MLETPKVEVFSEVTQEADDASRERVKANMKTRIEAAGLVFETASICCNYHPEVGFYVWMASVFPVPRIEQIR